MTMIAVADFLSRVEEIAAEEPSYRHGGYGQDGTCDCIGIIIGAIRRCGGEWRGLHGSNYAARREIIGKLEPIRGSSDLSVGDVVFKARAPGVGGYKLPDRYERGGEYYNGDLLDYFHVGVVVSVYPVRIRHMTTPRPKMDTSIGKWGWHGRLKKIEYGSGSGSESGSGSGSGGGPDDHAGEGGQKLEKVSIGGGNMSRPINMRAAASSAAPIIAEIPQGSVAEIFEGGGMWARVLWDGKTGYVKTEFVSRGDAGELVTVSKAELEKIYDMVGNMLGLRG